MIGPLAWIDWALLGVLGLSVLVGVLRGLVFELMSLAGWLVAYVVAVAYGPALAPHMPVGTPGSGLNQSAALAVSFVAALLVWAVLARLARLLIAATPLTVPDRVLGAVFGLVRGVLLLVVVATLVALTPAAQSRDWQSSTGARWLAAVVQGLKPLLPEPIGKWLPQA